MSNPWDVYHEQAGALAAGYEALPFEVVHAPLLGILPEAPGSVLDVGAGSGRDAAWFAGRGFDVVAVEPADALRHLARERHTEDRIQWLQDALPSLSRVGRSGVTFDLIWLSAVWMHVPPPERARAFRKLAALLNPGGRLVFTLREGPVPPGRTFHPVSADELEGMAGQHGLGFLQRIYSADAMDRDGVSWTSVVFQLPEDGSGALTLIRSLILRDRKASTYKLALLRVLGRIAEDHPGVAQALEDGTVELPLGLVALYWLRAYLPLHRRGLRQHPQAAEAFERTLNRLEDLDPTQLRPGAAFQGEAASHLRHSLREAAQTIRVMPATHLTHLGTQDPIFRVVQQRSVCQDRALLNLDEQALWALGRFQVPAYLWQAFRRWAPWVDPLLRQEWASYLEALGGARDLWSALAWHDPKRETGEVRMLLEQLQARGQAVYCVWSGRRLSHGIDIDHCFPMAAWPCQDLWNLMPAAAAINRSKSDKLIAHGRLAQAQERILDWWDRAYLKGPQDLGARFHLEARLSLSLAGEEAENPEAIFQGLALKRLALSRSSVLATW